MHHGHYSPTERETRLKQKGAVVWFTGLSGSGKSAVAREVERQLIERGKHAIVLDGDNTRPGLNKDLAVSPENRRESIRRIGEVAKLFCHANVVCLTAFISPHRSDREAIRAGVGPGQFVEVYCAATLEECEARDPKGLYKKARAGQIPEFTGVCSPYEAPAHPEVTLQTGQESVQDSARKVLEVLESLQIA